MKTSDPFFEKDKDYLSSDHYDGFYSSLVLKLSALLAKYYYGLKVHGLQNLKKINQPTLFVVNHSIGAPQDVLMLKYVFKTHSPELPIRGLAHKIAWIKPLSLLQIGKIGGIYAHNEVAEKFIEKGYSLICFPGGEIEAFRPFSERYQIDLADRQGFIEFAKKKQIPICPIVICGTHACYINVLELKWVTNLLKNTFRVKRFAISLEMLTVLICLIPPLLFLLPWALLRLVIPLPSKIEIQIQEPIPVDKIHELSNTELYQYIQSSMQSTMNDLAKKRLTPWF